MTRQFIVDLTTVRLSIELAIGEAVRAEVERQFCEQFPGRGLLIRNVEVVTANIQNINLTLDDDYEVVYR